MRKKRFIFAMCAILLAACNKENIVEIGSQQETSLSKENADMLQFTSENEYQQAVQTIASLDNKTQKEQWNKTKFGNFKSLKSVFDSAMIDAAKLDESKKAFEQYKEKYDQYLYFADYKDDCGAYLPVSNSDAAYLLNADGNVIIAGKVVNKKDIDSYEKLQLTGVAMYSNNISNLTRAGWGYNIIQHSTTAFQDKSNNVGEEFDSGWWVQNKRKVRLKCGRKVEKSITINGYKYTMKVHVEVSFRKKTWLGWANYASETDTEAEFSGGYNGKIKYHERAWSSHDFYEDVIHLQHVKNGQIFWYNAPIKGKLTVDFRGTGLLPSVEFTIGEVSVLMPPATIMPRHSIK
jgi:lipoprotein